jgi:hypothetical protein
MSVFSQLASGILLPEELFQVAGQSNQHDIRIFSLVWDSDGDAIENNIPTHYKTRDQERFLVRGLVQHVSFSSLTKNNVQFAEAFWSNREFSYPGMNREYLGENREKYLQ